MTLCTGQADPAFVGSVIRFVDCEAQALGSGGWHALALPGSTLSVVLGGFMTIVIALIGYGLLAGRSFTVRSATVAMVKIGAVFALATSWPAYRTLVYDIVVDGPAQITGEIGRPSAVPGSDGTLVQRLDRTDTQLAQLAIDGVGIGIRDDVPPPPSAGFNAFALGGSRILYLIAALAGLAGVRVVAGLMLALGPFFIAFLLFDSTRSLFEGWVRVLGGAALASIGVAIALGLELAMLEPWLTDILARRMAGEDLPAVPVELFVLACVYTLVIIAVLAACTRLARAFRLAPLAAHPNLGERGSIQSRVEAPSLRPLAAQECSRAAAVADVLVSLQRREAAARAVAGTRDAAGESIGGHGSNAREFRGAVVPVGRSFSRRARTRVTVSGGKRDGL